MQPNQNGLDGGGLVLGKLPDRDRSRDLHLGAGVRKYLPTLADLIDRLTIVTLKEIFIPEHRDEYLRERDLIQHDIDVVLNEKDAIDGWKISAEAVRAIAIVMLANRVIWENESKARAGGSEQDRLLKFTHSINGVRNAAKNILSKSAGERRDWKVDCFAAELVKDFGNWNIV
jgi:hypothetical protein